MAGGVLSSDICLWAGDKFERARLEGLSDTYAGVLSSGIHLWGGNGPERTLYGICPNCPVTLSVVPFSGIRLWVGSESKGTLLDGCSVTPSRAR